MKSENEFLLELYIQLKVRGVAPIMLASKVERVARSFDVKEPWQVLDNYVRKANEPIFAVVRNKAFIHLTKYGKNEDFSIIKKLIKACV
mgnify:CR=1 FL=1